MKRHWFCIFRGGWDDDKGHQTVEGNFVTRGDHPFVAIRLFEKKQGYPTNSICLMGFQRITKREFDDFVELAKQEGKT